MARFLRALTRAAALVFGVLLLPTVAPFAIAQTAETIRVGGGADDGSLPIIYAAKAGLYKKYGLNVEIVKLRGASAVAAALAGNSLEIGKGGTGSVVTAIAKGLPFTVIGSLGFYNGAHPDVGLVVAADAPVKTPKDLEGKTLATVTLQDQNSIFTFAWLDQHGVDRSRIKYVEIPASATLAAIEKGDVVGSTLYEPYFSQAIASGKVRVLGYSYDAVAKRFPDDLLFANASWAATHGDAINRFLMATQEASTYVGAHENESLKLMAEFTGVDPATMGDFRHDERVVVLNPPDLQPVIDILVKYKVIAKPVSAAEIICSCALRR
jgi:NitT/TauT family transport system substrate-binding protein